MQIPTHFLLGWLVAQAPGLDARGRAAIAIAGVAADLDGLGIIVQWASGGELPWFSMYHHKLAHNLAFALALAAVAWVWCRAGARPWLVALLVVVSAHLHLVCDLVGSRAPQGAPWPIPYWNPIDAGVWSWQGQWRLDSWQNLVITGTALVATAWFAWRRGFGPLEWFIPKADAAVVAVLRRRFGTPAG